MGNTTDLDGKRPRLKPNPGKDLGPGTDVESLVALLREDAVVSMPPWALWYAENPGPRARRDAQVVFSLAGDTISALTALVDTFLARCRPLALSTWNSRTGLSRLPPLGRCWDESDWADDVRIDLAELWTYARAVYVATDTHLSGFVPAQDRLTLGVLTGLLLSLSGHVPSLVGAHHMTSPQTGTLERPKAGAPKLRRPLHEGFPVKNAEASLKFYTEVLGLQVLPRPNTIGPGYWVGTEDKRVEFHIIETDSQYIPGPDAEPAAQARHTAWLVDSLEDLRRHLEGLGVQYREQKGRVGADQVFIVDPDGHTWEFQEPSALYPS